MKAFRQIIFKKENVFFSQFLKFKSSFSDYSIKPPPNPTMAESFGVKIEKKDLEKLMNPTGFLSEKDFIDYEGITPDGKIIKEESKVESKPESPIKKEETKLAKEYGFKVKGPEPTRFGDWERKGRVSDF